MLSRFGQKHPVGQFSTAFLDNYLDNIINGRDNELFPCGRQVRVALQTIDEPAAPISTEPDLLQDLFGPMLDQNLGGDFGGAPMPAFSAVPEAFMPNNIPTMPAQTTGKAGMAQFGSNVDMGVFLSTEMGASPLDFSFGQGDSDPWAFLQPQGVQNQ